MKIYLYDSYNIIVRAYCLRGRPERFWPSRNCIEFKLLGKCENSRCRFDHSHRERFVVFALMFSVFECKVYPGLSIQLLRYQIKYQFVLP